MKGQEIIDQIVRATMPDREQVREKIARQSASKTEPRVQVRTRPVAYISACAVIVLAAVLFLGKSGVLDMSPIKGGPTPPLQTAENTPGIYIPALELPEETEGVALDMTGLFVYQGRIYTQTAFYYGEKASAISGLVGERLGYATGTIDEWSSQDEYAVEFAGTVSGDVYSVKGYSGEFRLCTQGNYTDDNGTDVPYINFYENLNGIGLTLGSDLFADRLRLPEDWRTVQYQEHDNWDTALYNDYVYHDLEGVSAEDINAFLEALCSGQFEYVYESPAGDDLYTSGEKQTHLHLYMNDDTFVELRLFEGGYVGYRHLGWYFVKMPGDIFDLIFQACL